MQLLPDQWTNVTNWASRAAEANASAELAASALADVGQRRTQAEDDLAQLRVSNGEPAGGLWHECAVTVTGAFQSSTLKVVCELESCPCTRPGRTGWDPLACVLHGEYNYL